MSEIRKRIPQDTHITKKEIIKNKGYYDIDGNWNSILTFDNYPGLLFRGRVEVFILDHDNNVFLYKYNGRYRIPGGSYERNRSHKYQVYKEAKEEARIILGDIIYTNVSYFRLFDKKYEDQPMHWDGTYSEVYIGYFKKWYNGSIKKSVRDYYMTTHGRFYPFEYIYNILTANHKKAFDKYLFNQCNIFNNR